VKRRFARRADLGLTPHEFALLRRLDSPQKIQAFLFALGQNYEPKGDACRPVRVVLRERNAHCIEGAMLAAAALWVHGEPPLLMDLRATRDYDHVVTLYRRNGRWGAMSKTNGPVLRWREPVYRSLRELAMSYFHEYTNRLGEQTLREYSSAFDLRRVDPAIWVSGEADAWAMSAKLDASRHYTLITTRQARALVRRDRFERGVLGLLQYPRPRWLREKLARRRKQK